ncbi:MAG: acyl--CoA ligase [Clostridia bacterium]|nr:acyl--CoA ligase [Clostridia bacterium]
MVTAAKLLNACNCSMYKMLEKTASKNPEGVAISYFNNDITYSDLLTSVKKIAAALSVQGVGRGDNVIICMPNMPQAIIAIYACNLVGAVCHILHPLSTAREVRRIVEITSCKIAFCDRNSERCFDGLDVTLVCSDIAGYVKNNFKGILSSAKLRFKNNKNYLPAHVKRKFLWSTFLNKFDAKMQELDTAQGFGSDACAVLYDYSKGTMSSGIVITNSSVNVLAKQIHFYFRRYGIENGMLTAMPLFHGTGFGLCMHTAITIGIPQVLVPEFSPDECCKVIFDKKPDMIFLAPTFFEEIVKLKLFDDADLSFIRVIGSIGHYQHQNLKVKMNKLLKTGKSTARLISAYGRLECISVCAMEPPYNGVNSGGCVGMALPATTIKVVDTVTNDSLLDLDGEICINSPTVTRGYYHNPSATSKRLRLHDDGKIWFHTGDIGRITEDGVLYFKQCFDRALEIMGYTIYPSVIEDEICALEEVVTCCVVDDVDKDGNTVLCALVVPENDVNLSSKETKLRNKIVESVSKNLNYMSTPKKIVFSYNLPLSSTGSIDYVAVKEYVNDHS